MGVAKRFSHGRSLTTMKSHSTARWHAQLGCSAGQAGTADIVDASVALIAAARSRGGPTAVVTSDPTDLGHLLQTLGTSVRPVAI